MRIIKIVLLSLTCFIFVVFALFACDDYFKNGDNPKSLILFQYEYTNWAWGYSHSGWFIDNQGNVKGYNMPDDWKWPDKSGYIAFDSLIFNYHQTDTLYFQIDILSLAEKTNLIKGAINGELSDKVYNGADIGKMALYCYYWDRKKNKYKKQLLAVTGDYGQINTTSNAIQLTNYLIQIGELNKLFLWFP